jgi:hypothetical protein
MRASLLTRAGAAAAISAIAISGAVATAGTAGAAPAVAWRPTSLSISRHIGHENGHRITIILGDLRSRGNQLANKPVYLQRRTPDTGWITIGHENTGRFGKVVFNTGFRPNWRFRLHYRGHGIFLPSTSRTVIG